MAINTRNNIKCTHCQSTNKTLLADNFYHCNQCGFNYYVDGSNGGQLVQSKHSLISHNRMNLKRNFMLLAVIVIIIPLIIYFFYQSNIIEPVVTETVNDNISDATEQHAVESSTAVLDDTAYPRTAYVFHQDQQTHNNYLFKATFLTKNTNEDDTNAVSIKNENGILVAYDSLNGKSIPNFTQLIDSPLSPDAAVLYADGDSVIIKNMIDKKYQLEMIDPYTGNIIWTLSATELPGIDTLTKKYSSSENTGIELFRDNFRIKLPPKYYIIDKLGRIIGFGKIN